MPQLLKSRLAGAGSGAVTYFASVYAIGYTAAIAMPAGFPTAFWQAVVVFGLGAALVAFLVHTAALRIFPSRLIPALVGFTGVAVAALAVEGLLPTSFNALASWFVGALLASAVGRWLMPNNSFKPTPLRGAA